MEATFPALAIGQAGAFPRSELLPGEKVIFEGKPSLLSECFLGILWLVLFLGGGLLLFGLTIYVPPCALTSAVLALTVGTGPFLYLYARWSGTSFALTDRRVLLRRAGPSLRGLTSALPLGQVTQTARNRSYKDSLAGAGDIIFMAAAKTPGLKWPSVAEHEALGQYIDEQLERLRTPRQQAEPAAPNQAGIFPAPQVQPVVVAPPPGLTPLQIPARRCSRCGMNFGGDGPACPYCGAKA